MGSWLWTTYLIVSVLVAIQALLAVVQTWEHHRFAAGRLRSLPLHPTKGCAVVVVPCRGLDISLERNLAMLLRQDYGNYEVRFVVESLDDPACPMIYRVMISHPDVRCSLVVAGHSRCDGQKVHNLRAATANLPRKTEYLAFADSDARVARHWLRALVARLERPNAGAATGYRWFVPKRASPANFFLYSINASIAVFLGKHSPTLVWGGSWAIRRDQFESLRIRELWKGTLSDDLVASRAVRDAGLEVVFEPGCMVASPINLNPTELYSFIRRQYQIVRFYMPGWWTLMTVMRSFPILLSLGSLGAMAWCIGSGDYLSASLPGVVCAALYGISVLSGACRSAVAKLYFPRSNPTLRAACHFELWSGPLVALTNWIELLVSAFGNRIVWRGIVYQVSRTGQVELVRRQGKPAQAPRCPDAACSPTNDAPRPLPRRAAA